MMTAMLRRSTLVCYKWLNPDCSTCERLGWLGLWLALVAFCVLILLGGLGRAEAQPRRYWRSEATYTIRSGGDCWDVTRRLRQVYGVPQPGVDTFLVAQEIAYLNYVTADTLLPKGHKLKVPVYRASTKTFSGSIRNWHCAVIAGRTYRVSPALLVAVRSHENPKASRDWYGYGVKHLAQPRRTELNKLKKAGWSDERITRFQHHFLWEQADGAAKIIRRIAGRQKWSPMKPTPDGLLKLGIVYTGTGSTSWGPSVWKQYQKARGR